MSNCRWWLSCMLVAGLIGLTACAPSDEFVAMQAEVVALKIDIENLSDANMILEDQVSTLKAEIEKEMWANNVLDTIQAWLTKILADFPMEGNHNLSP